MLNTATIRIALTALLGVLALTACSKSGPATSVPEKGILAERTEFDFPEQKENHEKNMAEWKPIFDKYPAATSHTIVLDDGTKVDIPQKFQGLDLYKSKWAYETFTKDEFLAIDKACARERKRVLIVTADLVDLQEPLRVLCQQAVFVKTGANKSLR